MLFAAEVLSYERIFPRPHIEQSSLYQCFPTLNDPEMRNQSTSKHEEGPTKQEAKTSSQHKAKYAAFSLHPLQSINARNPIIKPVIQILHFSFNHICPLRRDNITSACCHIFSSHTVTTSRLWHLSQRCVRLCVQCVRLYWCTSVFANVCVCVCLFLYSELIWTPANKHLILPGAPPSQSLCESSKLCIISPPH